MRISKGHVLGLILAGLICNSVSILADLLVGTTDNGASAMSVATNAACTKFTATTTGTGTSIKARSGDDFGSANWVMAVYASGGTHPTGAPIMESTAATAVSAADTLYTSNGLTCATDCGITASTAYFICVWSDSANIDLSYAAGAADQMSYTDGETYPTWPTWNDALSLSRQSDVYVDGTPAAASGPPLGGSMLMGAGR